MKWFPHVQSTYDEVLEVTCGSELQRLARASSQERLGFICDARECITDSIQR